MISLIIILTIFTFNSQWVCLVCFLYTVVITNVALELIVISLYILFHERFFLFYFAFWKIIDDRISVFYCFECFYDKVKNSRRIRSDVNYKHIVNMQKKNSNVPWIQPVRRKAKENRTSSK